MANFFETSFVPQQPLVKVEAGMKRREPVNIALVVALVLFFVTVALAGGMYFWEKNTTKKVATAGEELAAKEKNFDINKINAYKSLQSNLRGAKTLVDEHTIFSVILDNIETNAAQNIGLTSLAYTTGANGSSVLLSGQAPSYKAVYFQVQQWRGMKPLFQDVEVTSLSLAEESGVVNFSVKIGIDARSLDFSKYIAKQAPEIIAATPFMENAVAPSSSALTEVGDKPETTTIKATTTKK